MIDDILTIIYTRRLKQKKKLQKLLDDQEIFISLKDFLENYQAFIDQKKITAMDLAESYLQLVDDMSYARLEFRRTGKYPCQTQGEAIQKTYNNPHIMTKYMLGLALSQFLWIQHYRLFCFYKNHLASMNFNQLHTFLEVGSGHGLFLMELLKRKEIAARVDVVDISSTALTLSKDIVMTTLPDTLSNIHFIHKDIMEYTSNHLYDFITMGEVLEHVENPQKLLTALSTQLKTDGSTFISTCVNAPAIDHVYHFKTVDEIRDLIIQSGFHIVKEIEIPSENVSQEKIEKYKIDILYGAIAKRRLNGNK